MIGAQDQRLDSVMARSRSSAMPRLAAGPPLDRVLDRISVDVIAILEHPHEPIHMGETEIRDQVDVQGRTGDSMSRAGHRAAHAIRNMEIFEYIHHRAQRCHDVGAHSPRSSM
jgi:hypothetical protein